MKWNQYPIPVYQLLVYPVGVQSIGTLRSDDGNNNENLIKVIGARASHFFVHFFAVFARLQRANS